MSRKFKVHGEGYNLQNAFENALKEAESYSGDKFGRYNFSFNLLEIKGSRSAIMDEERQKVDLTSELEVILEIEDHARG